MRGVVCGGACVGGGQVEFVDVFGRVIDVFADGDVIQRCSVF